MKKKIIIFCLIIFLITALFCTAYVIYKFSKRSRDKQEIEKIQNYMPEVVEDEKTSEMLKVEELQKKNEDVKAWIKIEGTHINYPVLQSENNEFYLDKDYKKQKSIYGSIFLKDTVNLDDVNSNVMIYGHNMDDGEMFHDLVNYKEESYYKKHNIIELTTRKRVKRI